MKLITVVATMLLGMFSAQAQEIGKPMELPGGGMTPMAIPQLPQPLPQPQLPGNTTLPTIPTDTRIPAVANPAPPMANPAAEAHAPKCWCTQPNPAGGPLIKYKCAPECCGQAGAEGCH